MKLKKIGVRNAEEDAVRRPLRARGRCQANRFKELPSDDEMFGEKTMLE